MLEITGQILVLNRSLIDLPISAVLIQAGSVFSDGVVAVPITEGIALADVQAHFNID